MAHPYVPDYATALFLVGHLISLFVLSTVQENSRAPQLAVLLLPTYLALHAKILESELVYADETHWKLIKKGGSKRWR